MSRMFIALTLAVAICLAIALHTVAAKSDTVADKVRVEQGLLSGTPSNHAEIRVFRGVPFESRASGRTQMESPAAASTMERNP